MHAINHQTKNSAPRLYPHPPYPKINKTQMQILLLRMSITDITLSFSDTMVPVLCAKCFIRRAFPSPMFIYLTMAMSNSERLIKI